jgi:o-succinylbenzoate---CoA ligase
MSLEQQMGNWLAIDRPHLLPVLVQKQQDYLHRCRDLKIATHIVIATKDADEFITDFLAGVSTGTPIFLANPDWGMAERQQLQKIIANVDYDQHRGQIMIPTGGTTGHLKFAIHTPATLTVAVRGFQRFYQVRSISSYCILPLHHVSGLMQLWRALLTGGRLLLPSSRSILAQSPVPDSFISLVPTQLQRILSTNARWLQQFRAVLIGGAPVWSDLLDRSRQAQIPLSLSYGMTETAAMVAALQPQDFLADRNASGQALPHVQLQVQESGYLTVIAESVMLGYYGQSQLLGGEPPTNTLGYWRTADLGEVDEQGYLQIWGRADHLIITGGEKVFPAEVEAVIRSTNLVTDVYVLGVPDAEWGERVVAVYVSDMPVSQIQSVIQGQLSNFKQPKTWLAMSEIPRNSQEKIDRPQILKMLSDSCS